MFPALVLCLLAAACGDGSGKTTVDPDDTEMEGEPTFTASEIAAQRAAEVRCRGAWQPLFGHINIEATAPRQIAASEDAIIYQVSLGSPEESLIRAFPTREPGPPVTLVNDWYSNLWVEGSRLFYTSVTPRLSSVPMEGGPAQLELEAAADVAGLSTIAELTAEHLYWLEVTFTDLGDWVGTVRRVPRSGGEPELMAELQGPFLSLQRAEGGGVIAWSSSTAAVVGEDGNVRYLQEQTTGVSVLGADARGVIVANIGLLMDGSIWRVPADGGARQPFLEEADFPVLHVWSDGAGGWLAHSVDYPPSGEQLVRLYTVSPDGRTELLACDPLVEGALELSNPIFTDDAVYFAAQYSNMWQLVRVSREPAAP